MSVLWALLNLRKALTFLTSPAGKLIVVLVSLALWTLYHRVDARRDCEALELSRELEAAQKQIEQAQNIADAARSRADASQTEMQELIRDNAELKQEVKDGKIATCNVPDDVRERLLRIR